MTNAAANTNPPAPIDNVARFAAGIKMPRKTDTTGENSLPGMRFFRAFGTQGAVWFAQGKTFEEAERLFDAQHDGILRIAGQIELPRKPAA